MNIDGARHCGRIRYEARIDPAKVILCHCTDCQTVSGAAYRANVPALAANFTLHGAPKTYEKVAASGNRMVLAFCENCGTALYSSRAENPIVYNLRLGAVAQRAQLTPKAQYWCASAMSWAMDISRIPQSPDQIRHPRTAES